MPPNDVIANTVFAVLQQFSFNGNGPANTSLTNSGATQYFNPLGDRVGTGNSGLGMVNSTQGRGGLWNHNLIQVILI